MTVNNLLPAGASIAQSMSRTIGCEFAFRFFSSPSCRIDSGGLPSLALSGCSFSSQVCPGPKENMISYEPLSTVHVFKFCLGRRMRLQQRVLTIPRRRELGFFLRSNSENKILVIFWILFSFNLLSMRCIQRRLLTYRLSLTLATECT